MERIETLVIGGGQAGLAISHHLSKRQRPHLVLERGRVGERWRSERWDTLHFQTPNGLVKLPGLDFPHFDPDAFATAAQIADYLEAYAASIPAPVRCGVEVMGLRRIDRGGFVAETGAGPIWAANVVAATGPYQRPTIPDLLATTPDVTQLHSSQYRAPSELPGGAVLVVGAGASGAQIAEELMQTGRQVYFSVSRHRRAPRRYRGHDHVWWWGEIGLLDTPPDPSGARPAPVVHSGANGGRTIDFRDFARDGMVLLGRAAGARNGVMGFAADLAENLAQGDAACIAFMDRVDNHIRSRGLEQPPDPEARRMAPIPASVTQAPLELDLRAANVRSVIWATGYGLDFSWIDVPVFDDGGRPLHRDGVTEIPGLYFLGLPFLSRLASSFLFGVGVDAERLAEHIDGRVASGAVAIFE